MGCYTDLINVVRDLNDAYYPSYSQMTVENCALFCTNNGYSYFGVQYSYVVFLNISFIFVFI